MNGSLFSQAVLLAHVPFSLMILATVRRDRALAIVLLSSILFLPERVVFDPPLLPALSKYSIPPLICLVSFSFMREEQPRGWGIKTWLVLTCVGLVGTIATNRDPLFVGGAQPIQALGPWDFVSIASSILTFGLPFELARRVYRTREHVVEFLRVLCAFGVVYCLLMMVEMRLSPQFHNWVYGFHQHSFAQTARGDGFRPVVFLAHGLATAMFCLLVALGATCLARLRVPKLGGPAGLLALFATLVLVLSRSAGATVYGLVALPLSYRAPPRWIVGLAWALGLVVIAMPLLRVAGWFPVDTLLDWSRSINADRAGSLQFRFDNEQELLDKWTQRPLFGWGGYARTHIFDENGNDASVADGQWIITLSSDGLIGFVAQFFLLTRPLWIARRVVRKNLPEDDRIVLASMALMLALFSVDLLPNGLFNSLPAILAGMVTGLCQGLESAPARSAHLERLRRFGGDHTEPLEVMS